MFVVPSNKTFNALACEVNHSAIFYFLLQLITHKANNWHSYTCNNARYSNALASLLKRNLPEIA